MKESALNQLAKRGFWNWLPTAWDDVVLINLQQSFPGYVDIGRLHLDLGFFRSHQIPAARSVTRVALYTQHAELGNAMRMD